MEGAVLLDDLIDFARSQPMVQEIVISDPVIFQHGQGDQQLFAIPARLHVTRERLLPIRLESEKNGKAQIDGMTRGSEAR